MPKAKGLWYQGYKSTMNGSSSQRAYRWAEQAKKEIYTHLRKLGVVAYTFTPSAGEAETERPQFAELPKYSFIEQLVSKKGR